VLSEGDIRELGVRNGGHRARLVSSLVVLREAQQRYGITNQLDYSSVSHLYGPWPCKLRPILHCLRFLVDLLYHSLFDKSKVDSKSTQVTRNIRHNLYEIEGLQADYSIPTCQDVV